MTRAYFFMLGLLCLAALVAYGGACYERGRRDEAAGARNDGWYWLFVIIYVVVALILAAYETIRIAVAA